MTTDAAETPPKKPRKRRVLRIIALAIFGIVALLAIVVAIGVYKPISRRAGSVVATAHAPDFSLEDQSGATTTLAALTARGPAVLVFYRGFW